MRQYTMMDVNGQQLGSLFPMNTTTAPAPAASSTGSAWANVFGQVAAGTLDFLKTREARKLEQRYVSSNQVAPGSLLAPGLTNENAGGGTSNPWPLIALAGGALLLMTRK